MHPSLRKHLLVAVICTMSAGASAVPSKARAYHTYKERLLDTTAYSLERREFRLGAMKLSYGIFKYLEISTYTVPWLAGLFLEEFETIGSPNVEFKSTLINRNRFALSVSVEFLWGRVSSCTNPMLNPDGQLCTTEAEFSTVNWLVYPISVTSSVRINSRISIHIGGQYTATQATGGTRPFEGDISGSAVVNMLQIYGMFEWRLSRVVALTVTTRWLPYVSQTVVRGQIVVDDDTGATIGIQADILDNNAFAVIPGAVFSWNRANIRLGVGYGAFFVEPVGLVVPASVLSSISPEFDVFVRF
ncbi:MAG TPA: hypothetical protein VFG22_02670 [Polyangiales bacterium]|nr:hypothetical protein [Polyangiales bacterium]